MIAENTFGLTGNYGLSAQKGNSITIKNATNSALKEVGCGFGVARSGRIGTFQQFLSIEEISSCSYFDVRCSEFSYLKINNLQ